MLVTKCPDGNYGPNCEKFCSARQCNTSSSSCDRETGRCPDGCKEGWRGEDCSSQCPEGTFGVSCTSCADRHCEGESDCPGDGTCSDGCLDGWMYNNCTKACPSGTYGPGCTSTCGNCTGDDSCNHVIGNCPGGCKPGWRGSQCKETCDIKTYGVNCKEDCGHCNGTCSMVDGHCPGGCEKGYNGTRCQLLVHDVGIDGVGFSVVPVVAGAVAGALALAISVMVYTICRRRRSDFPRHSKATVTRPAGVVNGGGVYVNVAFAQEETRTDINQLHEDIHCDPEPEEELLDEDEPSPSRDYYNDSEDAIRDIPIGELEDTVQRIKQSEAGFEAEYNRLPKGFTAPYDDSQKPENVGKNKYRGYYPYDHNRVRLSHIPDILGSDYINASLMHNYNQKKSYIAAQGPNKKTVGDFWRMIWEHRCGRVIMLTGLVEDMKVKCHQYWPDDGVLETDHFQVEVEVTYKRANYTARHLKVTSKDTENCRSAVQYHFTSWPDHGVPDTLALVHFIWMIRRTDTQTDGPLLVHCSAGIGRTGTYIAVDSLLDQARGEGMVDVLGYVSVMRGQRKNMIQTKEQYECVFQCLVEMTKFGDTSMDVESITTNYSSRGMDSTVDRKARRAITQMAAAEERNDCPTKHQMWVDGNQDFIVRVGPTLRHLWGYLQAVVPPQGLERLMWKLVEENDVHNIIVISSLQADLVGAKGATEEYGDVTVTTADLSSVTSDLTMVTLQLQMKNPICTRNVKLFKFSGSPTMDSMSALLLDHAHLQHLSAAMSPVVVIHKEPDRKSVVSFCIMGNILSGIVEDRRVDVIGHVRAFLKCCPDLVWTEPDIERFHDFAEKCVQMSEETNIYANM